VYFAPFSPSEAIAKEGFAYFAVKYDFFDIAGFRVKQKKKVSLLRTPSFLKRIYEITGR